MCVQHLLLCTPFEDAVGVQNSDTTSSQIGWTLEHPLPVHALRGCHAIP